MSTTKSELSRTKAELITINKKLEREVSILKTPPFLHACGSHYDYYYYYTDGPGIIPYTSLLYSSTNMEGGGLDINTGVFTAPQSGSYTVTWNTAAYIFHVQIFLYKNGEMIQESVTNSFEGGSSASYDQGKVILVIIRLQNTRSLGGRTLVVYLDTGDTLSLYYNCCGGSKIAYTTFCVSLSTVDII